MRYSVIVKTGLFRALITVVLLLHAVHPLPYLSVSHCPDQPDLGDVWYGHPGRLPWIDLDQWLSN